MTAQAIHKPLPAILRGMAGTLDLVTKASSVLSAMALAAILVLTLKEVAMRYFFNTPTAWTNDVNQWFFAIVVMLAVPEIARTNGHISISVLVDRMPHRKKDVALRVIAILSCLMCLAASYISGIETWRQFASGITTMWVSPIPKWWISFVIPFGFFLSGLQFLRLAIVPGTESRD